MISLPVNDSNLSKGHCPNVALYSDKAPIYLALPLYGYILPGVIVITLITNTFMVLVLSRKHLRTPSNTILLSMAVCEALTGVVSLPFMLFYYTFKGYVEEATYGLPVFWCENGPLLIEVIPTMLHTATIWQTVFLAIQRYLYVCGPTGSRKYCNLRASRIVIICLLAMALLVELPKIFSQHQTSMVTADSSFRECCPSYAPWLKKMGRRDLFYSLYYWCSSIFIHLLPCLLLLAFSLALVKNIRHADRRRRRTLKRQSRHSTLAFTSYQASTRMLLVVIFIFLCTEVPASVIYILHVFIATTGIGSEKSYAVINVALTLRNACIIISYPFNFTIYCSMSAQFRLTVRQLFTKEPLFVEQKIHDQSSRRLSRSRRYTVLLISTRKTKKLATTVEPQTPTNVNTTCL